MCTETEHTYEKATQILKDCRHQTGTPCEVTMADGTVLNVCLDCWNASYYERRAARKAELAAWNASLPKCQRCGTRPAKWVVGPFDVCGYCKTAIIREHNRKLAGYGVMAAVAAIATNGAPMVNTKDWKGLEK